MCNYIHFYHEKINKSGKGWKIFLVDGRALFKDMEYRKDKDGWINWRGMESRW